MNITEHLEVRLSTIAPVHIGCGEDYEPTHYVIQDGALYLFEPSAASLPRVDRDALLKLVDSPQISLVDLRKFFKDRARHFLPYTQRIVPVTPAVEAAYQKSFTDQQARNEARVEIDRTFFNPFDGQPIIPGSSLKGAIRTAVLDVLNNEKSGWKANQHMEMQKALMGGSFHTDPLRMFKISDARYLTPQRIGSKIIFAVSRRKETKVLNGRPDDVGKGIPTYKECLPARRRHAFELALDFACPIAAHPEKQPTPDKVLLRDFHELAKICNRYYRRQLLADIDLLQKRGFADEAWASPLLKALQNGELRQRLESGRACLLRVGRHSGAVSMTLNEMRLIKIMQAQGKPPTYENDTRQIWLAAEKKDATGNMLPFGWVLLEPADATPMAELQNWFEPTANEEDGWLQTREAAIRKFREEVAARKTELAAQAAREAEETAAAQAEANRRATLSQAGQEIETLREKFDKLAVYNNREKSPGDPICTLMRKIMTAALDPANNWNDAEKRDLVALCREKAKTRLTLGGKEKEIKAQWRQLAGEP